MQDRSGERTGDVGEEVEPAVRSTSLREDAAGEPEVEVALRVEVELPVGADPAGDVDLRLDPA